MAEHYLALYRKYRPQTFQDVCGRDAIVRTLKNQIISGRIGHSYLFCGTRGTGKTSIAKIFARAVNCENPQDGNPCCECASCRAISEDANLNVVEMDAASNNGVEDIRTVIDQVSYSPTQGKYRVFIIDEVHMLSTAAFNALLKTLEEPPSYAIFILATTEPNKLPVTILSRCQRYDFGRLPAGIIEERLRAICEKEGLTCEDRALRYIATAADGSMRDGLSILDQCNAFNYGNDVLSYEKTLEILGAVDTSVFSRLFRSVHIGDAVSALKIVDEVLSQGRELVQFVTDYIGYLRNVMLLKASGQSRTALDVSEEQLEWMLEDARAAEMTEVIRSINVFSELTDAIRYSSNRRILTETAVIRLCEPSMDIAEDTEGRILSLMERVRVLEERLVESQKQMLSGGYTMAPAAAGGGTAPETPVQDSSREEKTVKAAPVLPEAIPEDIKKVAAAWNRLISQIPADNHMAKIHLLSAKPTLGEDGKLLVVFENYINADYFLGTRGEENRQYFSEFLKARTGKDISVEYKLLDNQEKFTDNYVDIRGVINMEIVEEDD
ncbi:MAG: DNA polymerase III subunit gamma/tau [Lachnospiraceae bacterium]|nr:DNA polymerase III subunit gamma/tau [Lachnospiraceae bacterium]